jgi:hypothetical protein
MDKENLAVILKIFDTLQHDEQVDLFLAIQKELLSMRSERRAYHQTLRDDNQDNIDRLDKGDQVIKGEVKL